MAKILPAVLLALGSLLSIGPVVFLASMSKQVPFEGFGWLIYPQVIISSGALFVVFAFFARMLHNSEKQREVLEQLLVSAQKIEVTQKGAKELWYRVK